MKSIIENVITARTGVARFIPELLGNSFKSAVKSTLNPWLQAKKQVFLSPGLRREQAGILYADIVDYSRLTEQDEEGTHIRLVECMNIMKTHITENYGGIAHFAGDAILVEFVDKSVVTTCF
jgi:class 3 adenylate cyclase